MIKKLVECVECNAVMTVTHSMDPDHYTVSYCPSCGNYLGDPEPEFGEESTDD